METPRSRSGTLTADDSAEIVGQIGRPEVEVQSSGRVDEPEVAGKMVSLRGRLGTLQAVDRVEYASWFSRGRVSRAQASRLEKEGWSL